MLYGHWEFDYWNDTDCFAVLADHSELQFGISTGRLPYTFKFEISSIDYYTVSVLL